MALVTGRDLPIDPVDCERGAEPDGAMAAHRRGKRGGTRGLARGKTVQCCGLETRDTTSSADGM